MMGEYDKVRRGEIWWIELLGTEVTPNKTRPCVVISNDKSNECSNTLTVVPMTTKEDDRKYLPVHVRMKGIDEKTDTYVKCEAIMTVPKSRVKKFGRRLTPKEMKSVNVAILTQVGML